MAIGALFTPKLAGKVHDLHYQSNKNKQNENFAIILVTVCINHACKRVRMFIVIIGLNTPDYSHLSNFTSTVC